MNELIKQIVKNMLNSWQLTDYRPGTVISTDPFQIRVNENLILESVNILLTSESPSMSVGDKVIMLRCLRGQKYIVLGKAVA